MWWDVGGDLAVVFAVGPDFSGAVQLLVEEETDLCNGERGVILCGVYIARIIVQKDVRGSPWFVL